MLHTPSQITLKSCLVILFLENCPKCFFLKLFVKRVCSQLLTIAIRGLHLVYTQNFLKSNISYSLIHTRIVWVCLTILLDNIPGFYGISVLFFFQWVISRFASGTLTLVVKRLFVYSTIIAVTIFKRYYGQWPFNILKNGGSFDFKNNIWQNFLLEVTLREKLNFLLKITLVNVNKSANHCEFIHTY